jgi:hypothetical protein
MQWTEEQPKVAGFYYWQNQALYNISPNAVRVVQVSQYANRKGFSCEMLVPIGQRHGPYYSGDLGQAPSGLWAGPLPQPYD